MVSFVHVMDVHVPDEQETEGEEGEQATDKGEKEKETAETKKTSGGKVLQIPRSIVGLVKGDSTPDISNLRKFVTVTKEKLLASGPNCTILEEKEVVVGGTKGKELVYHADAPGNQKMKCMQRLCLSGEYNFVILFQTLEPFFDEELELALPVINSFQLFN